jgi:hypothetical protein
LLWWKIGFKDRFQHEHRCCHQDPCRPSGFGMYVRRDGWGR